MNNLFERVYYLGNNVGDCAYVVEALSGVEKRFLMESGKFSTRLGNAKMFLTEAAARAVFTKLKNTDLYNGLEDQFSGKIDFYISKINFSLESSKVAN